MTLKEALNNLKAMQSSMAFSEDYFTLEKAIQAIELIIKTKKELANV